MVEVYDAHEQGEVVKKWLTENGSAIVMGLVIAFGGLTSRQQASIEFEVMDELLSGGQLDAAMANFQNLQDEYPKSPYTSMAALQFARARIESNQPDLAIGLLEYVMENGHPMALTVVARERLARVLLDQGEADRALTVLDAVGEHTGFESRYAEVRGDIHFDQGRMDEAVVSYLEAMELLEAGAGDRGRLQMKLESMGAEIPEAGNGS
jgi:predicted negative regulator of RcsB-dependent stress response